MCNVVILIPGIMGSVLELDGEVIWPGSLPTLIAPYAKMKELMRNDLVPTDCIRNYFLTGQYQRLISDLERCGFNEQNNTLIVCAYDWRKDNSESARLLGDKIDNVFSIHGKAAKISLIGHSMGGLIGRFYLESGLFKKRIGYKNVESLITLGTPHRGAPLALPLVLGYEKRLFLNKGQVLQICSDVRYPAAYQLLPQQDEPFAWDGSAGNRYNQIDIYNSDMADHLGLVRANLQSAKKFHALLNIGNRPDNVRYFCFAGSRQTTATHVLIRTVSSTRKEPVKIEQEDGGDGTVPTWSGYINSFQRLFVGGEHGTIYHNNGLRRILATLLGKEGLLIGISEAVEIVLREKVVEPHDNVHVNISFGDGTKDFSGVLTLEKCNLIQDTGNVSNYTKPKEVHPINYKGVGLENMTLVFKAPQIRGVYRVALRNDLKSEPVGYDELIVQQPLNP